MDSVFNKWWLKRSSLGRIGQTSSAPQHIFDLMKHTDV